MDDANAKAVAEGVHDAFLGILRVDTNYPMSRDDLLAAVTEGVRQAFADVLGKTL